VNPSKSWLIVKPEFMDVAKSQFENTSINITSEGRCYLGSPIGSDSFVINVICEKIRDWISQLDKLTQIAHTQPHSAYSCLQHGFFNKFTYFFRSTPGVCHHIDQLEDCLRLRLIPALTGHTGISDSLRLLLSFPSRLGGMGLSNPKEESLKQYTDSIFILSPLIDSILLNHDISMDCVIKDIFDRKGQVAKTHSSQLITAITDFRSSLSDPSLICCLDVAGEKGASTWLTALPIQEHGFALHKGAFRDAISLGYGWTPTNLLSHCICGTSLSVEHALNCKCGGFPSLRHNEVRDITADLLTEVCHNVMVEPPLQPLSGESLSHRSAITEDNARVDVAVSSFWSAHQRSFLDVRVYNPFSCTYAKSTLKACHRRHEAEKRRQYSERVNSVEFGSFTPLVFTTAGGMGPAATVFYKRLASLISIHRSTCYSQVLNWIRCRLSFSLLRSSITCLLGAHSSLHHPIPSHSIALALSEGRVS
jgi:hypothetical protein